MEIVRHFTASAYIVFKNKVLLHKHKKYGLVLPLGGHIDRDELPSEAIIREAMEEGGLEVELYNSNKLSENYFKNSIELNRGEHLNLHKVGPQHEHIDFVFYAYSNSERLNPGKDESKNLRWYSMDEILSSDSISEEVRTYALDALEKLKK